MMLKERLLMSQKPFKITGIEHVGIAVESLDGVSDIFSDVLGLDHLGEEEVKDQGVLTDIYDTGAGKLEFLKATDEDSPISKFISKKGASMHHVALKVDNLDAAIEYLDSKGIELIDTEPRRGAEGLSIAFLHPRSTAKVLVELCQK